MQQNVICGRKFRGKVLTGKKTFFMQKLSVTKTFLKDGKGRMDMFYSVK